MSMFRRGLMMAQGGGDGSVPGVKESEAGDICLFNKKTNKKIIVKLSQWSSSKYPSDTYSPIGIVVIPSSHDIYGDGSCSIVSLKYMNSNSPDTGSVNYSIVSVGGWGYDIPSLSNYRVFNTTLNTYDGSINGTTGITDNDGELPSDSASGIMCKHDNTAYYVGKTGKYLPSPYLNNGDRNPGYYQTTSPSNAGNALSDFDGLGNNEIMINLVTKQPNWKTDDSIIVDYPKGYHAAACCCWRYHTEGTDQGNWYLPAIGELGYFVVRFEKISNTANQLLNYYGNVINYLSINTLVSSTERISDDVLAFSKSSDYGFLAGALMKSMSHLIIAFTRIK